MTTGLIFVLNKQFYRINVITSPREYSVQSDNFVENYCNIIKDLFFNEIDLLTEDTNKEMSLYMISLIAQLKDN